MTAVAIERGESGAHETPDIRDIRETVLRLLQAELPSSYGRALAVASLSRAVGECMGLAGRERDEVVWAAELSAARAREPGVEAAPSGVCLGMRRFMRTNDPALRRFAAIVGAIEERWDGSGEPQGLRETQIPLGARIIAVCEVLAASLADVDSSGATTSDVLATLRAASGVRFDPAVVDCVVRALRGGLGGLRFSRPLG